MKGYSSRPIYDKESGYLAVSALLGLGYPFNFFVTGRGTGKTYNALRHCIEGKRRFIFFRRTDAQLSMIANDALSPLEPLNRDLGLNLGFHRIKGAKGAYLIGETSTGSDGKRVLQGEPVGIALAISTLANIRGFNALDYDTALVDEYVPERHGKLIKAEGFAFLNAVETIARNRELYGKPPVQWVFMGNSDNISAPMNLEAGIIPILWDMGRKGRELYVDDERGLLIARSERSPISERKKGTSLYRFTGERSDYGNMALGNEYDFEGMELIGSRNLKNMEPVCGLGGCWVYRDKSDGCYYVSRHRKSAFPETYGTGTRELERFRRKHAYLWFSYLARNVVFEDALCCVIFTESFKA